MNPAPPVTRRVFMQRRAAKGGRSLAGALGGGHGRGFRDALRGAAGGDALAETRVGSGAAHPTIRRWLERAPCRVPCPQLIAWPSPEGDGWARSERSPMNDFDGAIHGACALRMTHFRTSCPQRVE